MMNRIAIALLFLLILILPRTARAQTTVLRIGTGGDYLTLTAALAVAQSGAVLEILPGVQVGQWTIDRPMTLRGHSGAILDGAGQGTLLHITANNVTIEGLTIRNSGRSLLNDDAAIKLSGHRAQIRRNRLEDVHHAIYVFEGASAAHISHNSISGREDLIPEDRGNGIHLWNAPDTIIEDNIVSGVRDGIYVGFAPRSAFYRNQFQQMRYGVHFMYADDNIFEDNRFSYSEAGAALMYSRNITLRRNLFAHSRSNRAYGLLLQECDHVVAEDNALIDNSRALFVNVSRDSLFRYNRFIANDLAIQIYAGSVNNRFETNDFLANLELITMDQPGSNQWQGNYWEEYRGIDSDSDGYGDSPFITGDPLGPLITDYPQLRLFRFSPAVQALALAERAFPVLELPEARDLRPAFHPITLARTHIPTLAAPRFDPNLPLIVTALGCLALAISMVWFGRHSAKSYRLLAYHHHDCHRIIQATTKSQPSSSHQPPPLASCQIETEADDD